MSQPIIIVIGTRPEAIKMLPIYFRCKEVGIPVLLCSTEQHDELINEVLHIFNVKPDFNFSIMRPGQDLFYITKEVMTKMKLILDQVQPSLVLVQGDTTTTLTAALSAFYKQIPVGHIEAGLRTYDSKNPFPEETNRRSISTFSDFNFAPTAQAQENLLSERIDAHSIFVTGNTVVDALHDIKRRMFNQSIIPSKWITEKIAAVRKANKKIITITAHRRESFNGGIERILSAAKEYALKNPHVVIMYPYHPNPYVLHAIEEVDITTIENIISCKAISYKDMIYLLDQTDCIITDSGGVCEEGVTLGKPVLITRDKTERMEAVAAGCAQLVGTVQNTIIAALDAALYTKDLFTYQPNLYGDGDAAKKIVEIIAEKSQTKINAYSNKSYYHQKEMS